MTSRLRYHIVQTVVAVALTPLGACYASTDGSVDPPVVEPQSGTLISLPEGDVQGRLDRGTRTFIGIPYASPPLGALRWKPPMAMTHRSTTLEATGPGVACIQPGQTAVKQTEDCLTVNVFAPAEVPEKPLPVLVWLHGGENVRGSANDVQPSIGAPLYDGASLRQFAKEQVVVVTVNYRLGALGFLSHRGLRAEGGASGNYGLMDQQAALRWVQSNITAFGGDPSRVTLFGQGAGASDACYQLLANDREGLIGAAILESGTCGEATLLTAPAAEARGATYARGLGCQDHDVYKQVACLRAKPASELAAASLVHSSDGMPATDSLAVVDGVWLHEQPGAALAAGRFEQVPIIVGSNAREGAYFMREQPSMANDADYRAWLSAKFGVDRAAPIAAQYALADAKPDVMATNVITDAFFACPAERFASAASAHTDVYKYSFERAPYIEPFEQSQGATYEAELLWVWDVWPKVSPYAADDVGLAQTMAGYWSRLVDGDPNGMYAPEWPRYDDKTRAELVLNLGITTRENENNAGCDLWQKLSDDPANTKPVVWRPSTPIAMPRRLPELHVKPVRPGAR